MKIDWNKVFTAMVIASFLAIPPLVLQVYANKKDIKHETKIRESEYTRLHDDVKYLIRELAPRKDKKK